MDWILTAGAMDVADAWSARSGLGNGIDRLRTVLPRAHALIDQAERGRFVHTGVAELVARLKDAAYDAEDLIDELDVHEWPASGQHFTLVYAFARDVIGGTVNRVRDVKARLEHVLAELERIIQVLDMHGEPMPQHARSVLPETSSFVGEPEVFGRDSDGCRSGDDNSDAKRRKKTESVPVLPIVGIGGVGKTTLAQIVYGDQRMQDYFHLRMWVCVTESFDVTKVTRQMIDSVTNETRSNLANLNSLQEILKDAVLSRRFLLVLDDVWNEDGREWQTLCAPLRHALQGSVILVTTRSLKVANMVGATRPVSLEGLPDEAYWDLFKRYAFGVEDATDHLELVDIAKKIVAKLKGSPLAAKTVGSMLNSDVRVRHWRTVMCSELWELEQGEGDILPALRLSYQYLPSHLKRCFSFCSIFPKGHVFRKESLIDMWIAEGFVAPQEGIGNRCLQDLLSRSFFQQGMFTDFSCVMHDLMCDLARSISVDECFWLETDKWQQKIPSTVRHLSVCTKYLGPSELADLSRHKKLRSLVFFDTFEPDSSSSVNYLLERLTNIRLLVLRRCTIKELPKSIGNLRHLRYLDISSTKIRRLPESVCGLQSLQVLNMQNVSLESYPKGMDKLINLRKFYADGPVSSTIANLRNLTSLQNSLLFAVPQGHGHRIAELKDLTELCNGLHIKNLENVKTDSDAAQAMLHRKEYLRELALEWSPSRTRKAISGHDESVMVDDKVLEALQPHPNLEHLEIRCYGGHKSPSWLQTHMLHCLHELWILDCAYLEEITSLPSSLTGLRIENCPNLTSLECIQTHCLPNIQAVSIGNCPALTCRSKLVLPRCFNSLLLRSCGYLEESLPDCLCDLTSLTYLGLYRCANVTSLPEQVLCHLRSLKGLFVYDCDGLRSVGGLHHLSSLVDLQIVNCSRLTEVDPSMFHNACQGQGMRKLEWLTVSDTSLLRLMMRSPLPALQTLVICRSSDCVVVCGPDEELLQCLQSLWELWFQDCSNLQSLPAELHSLNSLQFLRICNCPKIQSLPEKGLPSSLKKLSFEKCHPVLVEQLQKLQISCNTEFRFVNQVYK